MDFLNSVARKHAVVFVLSDFLTTGFEKSFRVAAKKHDLISIFLSDPREHEIPSAGLVELEDAETGQRMLLDTADRRAVAAFREHAQARVESQMATLSTMGVDIIQVTTGEPYDRPLQRFFERRARLLRH